MTSISLEIDKEVDQGQLATILEQLGKQLREDDVESKELMDGSYRFKVGNAVVWLNYIEE